MYIYLYNIKKLFLILNIKKLKKKGWRAGLFWLAKLVG